MKLIIIRTNLKDGISIVENASNNSNLQILKSVFIHAEDNKIILAATNLEIAITHIISGKTIENGSIVAPIGVFSDLINNIPSERLNLEEKNGNIEIKTDNYQAVLNGQPASDFPVIPKIKNTSEYFEIPSDIFRDSLENIVAASQFSNTRPELNGVLFNFSLDSLRLTATDSFRLAEKTINTNQFKTNHQKNFRFLIPLKTCLDVLKVFKSGEELKIHHDENQILFKTNQTEMISRLMEGNFPEYDYLIPKKFNLELTADRQEFINALKLSGIFGAKVSEIKIKISDNKKSLEISSTEQGLGENKYLLPSKIHGELKEVNFNWRYLLDGLKSLKTKEVFFGINEENKPALLRNIGDNSYFYILMPIIKA